MRRPIDVSAVGRKPSDVREVRRGEFFADEVPPAAELRFTTARTDECRRKTEKVAVLFEKPPLNPRNGVVLTPGVVITPLSSANFVTGGDHRYSLAEQQCGQEISHLAPAQVDNFVVIGFSFNTAVITHIIVFAVAIILAVLLVVLLVIRDQIV